MSNVFSGCSKIHFDDPGVLDYWSQVSPMLPESICILLSELRVAHIWLLSCDPLVIRSTTSYGDDVPCKYDHGVIYTYNSLNQMVYSFSGNSSVKAEQHMLVDSSWAKKVENAAVLLVGRYLEENVLLGEDL